jgi:hypothetical protein
LDNWEAAHNEFRTGYRNVNGQTTRIGIAALSAATNQADTSLRKAWHQAKDESASSAPDAGLVEELATAAQEIDDYLSLTSYEYGKPVHRNNVGAFSSLHNYLRKTLTAYKTTKP